MNSVNLINGSRGTAASPSSSGPAGPLFEGMVGAHYLLSMLAAGEPRGLPGTITTRVEFQRASDVRPLDDVVVHAVSPNGASAVLEIQAKRSMTFTASEDIFRSVVAQIVKASSREDFATTKYELAVALERTSTKIERSLQAVLSWARELTDSNVFDTHLSRSHFASEEMRGFVREFRRNLKLAGGADDPHTVWHLLRRFQILVFDFNQAGSASELLARERASMLLVAGEVARGGELWDVLVQLALRGGANAGEHTLGSLRETLVSQYQFRFAGDRRLRPARNRLLEASQAALVDIEDRVGHIRIDRTGRVAAVHAALDAARYVEIRGGAGVGKSGVLRQVAERIGQEARTLVFSPDRTPEHGWVSLSSTLGCEATAREFLSDLASDGSAVLFIDGVDFFDTEAKRVTVKDLVRAAADVRNFSIVVTARPDFGIGDTFWLPQDAVDKLGRAPPVLIDELDADEIAQLKSAHSSYAELLSDGHPAREVVRNLFRLARLASHAPDEAVPHTEAEMAQQWWRSGGGGSGEVRERIRVLRFVAAHAIESFGAADVSKESPTAIDQLKANGSFRELQPDRVVFQHDVLREWALGCLLVEEPQRIAQLPLSRPAPDTFVRGIEVAAKHISESSADGKEWAEFASRLAAAGIHGTWRRAVVLALIRSELGPDLLKRVAPALFASNGALLSDLIRMVVAVESTPGAPVLAQIGIDAKAIPEDFVIPVGQSWSRLVVWTLISIADIPKTVIPDLVDLYSRWCMGTLGNDALTPHLMRQLLIWLEEVESAHYPADFRRYRRPFDLDFSSEQIRDLESELRTAFLLFCSRVPALADRYLRSIPGHRGRDRIAESVLKFRGTAAQAAPSALVDLTLATLIPKEEDHSYGRRDRWGPFEHHDIHFLPASPTQGPFLDLLVHAPEEGLRLIRALVDHAVGYYTGGQECGNDTLVIPFPDRERAFPWTRSYAWARDGHSYVITSALMALEAWGHLRIEAGESLQAVQSRILGTGNTPAAFVLVVVDLLLSHWPKSKEQGWPYLACPELLVLDHGRAARDAMGATQTDFLDAGTLDREPAGTVRLADLRRRPSRGFSLDQLIGNYVFIGSPDLLATLRARLADAAQRVGPPDAQDPGMGDVRFAAAHAVNLANPNNWREETVRRRDGSDVTGHRYHSPAAEREMLEPAAAVSNAKLAETQLFLALAAALDNREKSSPELVAAGVAWAQELGNNLSKCDDGDSYLPEWRARTKVIAAALAMRDGDSNLKSQNAEWARSIFVDALARPDDRVQRHQASLSMNFVAAAGVGTLGLLSLEASEAGIRTVLEVAGRSEPSMAFAFAAEARAISSIDKRLPQALMRVGFSACIHARRGYGESEESLKRRKEEDRTRIRAAIDYELTWLSGTNTEPVWPAFPLDELPRMTPRRTIRLPGGKQDNRPPVDDKDWKKPGQYVDHQGAALWLHAIKPLIESKDNPWVREVIDAYADWTAAANGVGQGENSDSVRGLMEWNSAYFSVLAFAIVGLSPTETDQFALNRISAFPDEPFFDVTAEFIRKIDELFFNRNELPVAEVIRIRSVLADRLVKSRGWRYLVERNSSNIEWHIGPAIASLFMHEHSMVQRAQCYLLPKGAERVAPFLPMLTELTVSGARSAFLAALFIGLVEVKVQPAHLEYLVRAGSAWMAAYSGEPGFWVDLGIGRRICAWVKEAVTADPGQVLSGLPVMLELDALMDGLVRAGVAQARPIEDEIARLRQRAKGSRLE